jgi:hypothetical protein
LKKQGRSFIPSNDERIAAPHLGTMSGVEIPRPEETRLKPLRGLSPEIATTALPFNSPKNHSALKNARSMDYAFVIFSAMLSFPMFVPSQSLRGVSRPDSLHSRDTLHAVLNPLLRYSYKLFCHSEKVISFRFILLRALSAKHPGWGVVVAYPRLQKRGSRNQPRHLLFADWEKIIRQPGGST